MSEGTAPTGSIGYAVKEMRDGKRVRRRGWNGKDQWISLTPARIVDAADFWSKNNQEHAQSMMGGKAHVREYVTMKTVEGQIVPWVCSQTDLLSFDWEVVT